MLPTLLEERQSVRSAKELKEWRKKRDELRWSDPFLQQFDDKEIRFSLGDPRGPLCITIEPTRGNLEHMCIDPDKRLVPYKKHVTWIQVGSNFCLPPHQEGMDIGPYCHPEIPNTFAFLGWGNQNEGRYEVVVEGEHLDMVSELLFAVYLGTAKRRQIHLSHPTTP